MEKNFSITGAYKEAYELMKPRVWTIMGEFLVINMVLSLLFYMLLGQGAFIGSLITSFVAVKWSLAYANKGSFAFDDIFDGVTFRGFVYYVIAVALMLVSVVGGMILLVIPGLIFAIRLMFVKYVVIEDGLKPMDALRESKKITKGVRWKLLGLVCVSVLVFVLGFVCLIVGAFFALPLIALANVIVYKKLKAQSVATDDVVEVVVETVEVSEA